jgi:hypothetical protein
VVSALAPCNSGTQSYDLSSDPDGVYTFKVRQNDGVNTSGVAVSSFQLDRVAPAGPHIITRPRTPSRKLHVSWSFTGEPNATFGCKLSRGRVVVSPWHACTSPKAYDLTGQPDGRYTFKVRQTDQARNRSVVTRSRYRLDRVAPRLSLLRVAPNPFDLTKTRRCTIRFRLGEAGKVTVKIKRGSRLVRTLRTRYHKPGTVRRYWDGKNSKGRLVKAGRYTVVVIAVDRAGNKRVRTHRLTVRR